MAKITIRTSDTFVNDLDKLFPNPSKGAEIAVEAFIAMRKQTLQEIKGIFTQKELFALVATLVGYKIVPEYQVNKEIFLMEMKNNQIAIDCMIRYDANFSTFIDKIQKLTSAQVFFLQCEIICYLKNKVGTSDIVKDLL